jgi:cob(I)alamin adenosyltransferase
MVNLTRIYTKTGDDGTTSLGDMSRTSKNDPRLEAYATVDEANSSIGVVLALGQIKDPQITKLLIRIQNDLFDVGADLCTPVVDEPKIEPLRVIESQVTYLEEQIDFYNESL